MFHFNKLFRYPIKRRKRSLFSALCLLAVVYAGFQIINLEDEYSPLQLLSSVENEASRLLHFITQAHIQCNSSTPTSNVSYWVICQDASLGLTPDISAGKGIVYSVGPGADSSFEQIIDKNSSYHLYIFSSFKRKQWDNLSNHTTVIQKSVVPNDPSDFARNSFQTGTLNSIHQDLQHKKVNIVKIDNQLDVVHYHELLHFLIQDSWLDNVKELHFVLQLDKVEEDDIYNWYRVLYSLFHKSGFRLYHTAASNSLCLQDTIMESCKYYLSWLKDVPPHTFVLYPPAVDGSLKYEVERMTELLEEMPAKNLEFYPISLKLLQSSTTKIKINETTPPAQLMHFTVTDNFMETTHPCTLIFILNSHVEHVLGLEKTKCNIISLRPLGLHTFESITLSNPKKRNVKSILTIEDINSLLEKTVINIMVLEMGESWDSWGILMSILNQEIPKALTELVLQTTIFQHYGKPHPMVLRRKYSAMKQIETYSFVGAKWEKQPREETLKFGSSQEIDTLNFIRIP